MANFKIRKSGSDLHTLKEYNTYGNGAYNAFHPEYAPKSVGGTMSGVSNKESKGNCTWYVGGRYQEMHGVRLPYEKRIGNAGDWVVDTQTPSVGAIAVFTDSQYGHVGSVEEIDGNRVILSESAYSERGNDFLFKYGRTVEDVCNVWGMKLKGYINPPKPVEPTTKWKVGDLVEYSTLYPNSTSNELAPIKKVNHLWRGVGYIKEVRPSHRNHYVVSQEKGGETTGAIREYNIFRVNQSDMLDGLRDVNKEVKLNAFGQNAFRYTNITFSQIFKNKNGDETLPLGDGKGQVAWVHEWATNPYEVWKDNALWGYVRPENTY